MGTGEASLEAATVGLRAGRTVAFTGGRGAGRTTALRALAHQARRHRRVIEVRGRPGFADQPLAAFGELDRGGPTDVVRALIGAAHPPLIAVDDPHHLGVIDVCSLVEVTGGRPAWSCDF